MILITFLRTNSIEIWPQRDIFKCLVLAQKMSTHFFCNLSIPYPRSAYMLYLYSDANFSCCSVFGMDGSNVTSDKTHVSISASGHSLAHEI